MEITLCHASTRLNEPVGERRLAMINMGDDAEVSYMFHRVVLSESSREKQPTMPPVSLGAVTESDGVTGMVKVILTCLRQN